MANTRSQESTDERTFGRKVGDYVVYLILRAVVLGVRILPWFAVRLCASMLAWFCYLVDRRHREVAIQNISVSFPELPQPKVRRLCRRCFRHFIEMLFEMIKMPGTLRNRSVDDYFWFAKKEEGQAMRETFASGRPLLALSGHFGNWEVFNYMAGVLGYKASVVARRLDNPHIDGYLDRLRTKTGQRMLDKRDDYPEILQCLKNNEMLGILADQDAGPRGVFADFLGRPASTFKSIAVLSLSYSAPILVFGAARVARPMKYALYVEDIILPEDYAHRPDAVQAITQRYCDAVAEMVKRHPEQYFWFHRRWKTPPKPARTKLAA